jgi:hypothetical protein
LFNLLNALLILNDDNVLKVSFFTASQGIDPMGPAGVKPDGKFVRVLVSSVTDVMAIQVAMETLSYFRLHIY